MGQIHTSRGPKAKRRKRHVLVDTLGLTWGLAVHEASEQDRDGARLVVNSVPGKLLKLEVIWADGAYAGQLIEWVKQTFGWFN